MMSDEFETFEQKGRTLLKSFLDQIGATDQQPTTGKYNPVDYYFTLRGEKYVVEIKCRDIKYKDYDTHMIEDCKLKALLQAKKDDNCDYALYINFFRDDIVYLYSTTDIINKAKPEIKYCNRTTAIDSGKINKLNLMIPTSVAKVLIRKDGKWQTDNSNNKIIQYGT